MTYHTCGGVTYPCKVSINANGNVYVEPLDWSGKTLASRLYLLFSYTYPYY